MSKRLFHASAAFLALAALAKPAWAVSPDEYVALVDQIKRAFIAPSRGQVIDDEAEKKLSDLITLSDSMARQPGASSGKVLLKVEYSFVPSNRRVSTSAVEVPLADLKSAARKLKTARTPADKAAASEDVRQALEAVRLR
ncbi:hypothetical protein [Hyphomonas chukchiensis]|uniref:Uncharacterized protein n=1 Tax=Hyphomonas chukchiensis TaxID=1280947 RepID=A0A062UKN5_9PROT|nr:hypothetical protein [Hyphomonas chukchiensis]KCZ60114.1 hypothetical protein HY30_12800 [Hyphomonas chukchiensis]